MSGNFSTIDAPLSDLSWSLIVIVVGLAWFCFVVIVFRMHSNCQLSGWDLQKIITLVRAFTNGNVLTAVIIFTSCNEVVAQVKFLHLSVIHSVHRG